MTKQGKQIYFQVYFQYLFLCLTFQIISLDWVGFLSKKSNTDLVQVNKAPPQKSIDTVHVFCEEKIHCIYFYSFIFFLKKGANSSGEHRILDVVL